MRFPSSQPTNGLYYRVKEIQPIRAGTPIPLFRGLYLVAISYLEQVLMLNGTGTYVSEIEVNNFIFSFESY